MDISTLFVPVCGSHKSNKWSLVIILFIRRCHQVFGSPWTAGWGLCNLARYSSMTGTPCQSPCSAFLFNHHHAHQQVPSTLLHSCCETLLSLPPRHADFRVLRLWAVRLGMSISDRFSRGDKRRFISGGQVDNSS